MKPILAPSVTLISKPQYINPDHLGWRANNLTPPGQAIAELAGRICYMSIGEDMLIDGHQTVKGRAGNAEYIENILDKQHGSVIEHANYGFLIEGISRSLSHELVRHRAGFAYSQLSQRFVNEGGVRFVAPPALQIDSTEYRDWLAGCAGALHSYREILATLEEKARQSGKEVSKKQLREVARSVLPNATETKMVVTGNARAWRHFMTKRGNKAADREIRRLACNILIYLKAEAPDIFGDMDSLLVKDGINGEQHITLKYHGV